MFATAVSKEFCARMMTAGYLDGVGGKFWCKKGSANRPFSFELYSLEGMQNEWVRDVLRIGEMSDEELFGAKRYREDIEQIRRRHGFWNKMFIYDSGLLRWRHAVRVREQAEVKLGYHENHGK